MWLESDRLANPVFREFYSERDVILEERRQTLESRPGGTVDEAFNAMTWMAHPYQLGGHRLAERHLPGDARAGATSSSRPTTPRTTSPRSSSATSTPRRPTLSREKYFGRIPANPKGVPEVVTLEPPQPAEQRMVAEVEMTPSVEVDYKAVPAVHKDAPGPSGPRRDPRRRSDDGPPRHGPAAMRPPSGRLHRSLVLDKKVATRASASFRGQKYGGLFALSATPAPGKRPDEVEPLLYAEIDKVVKEGVTDDELAARQERDPGRPLHPPREQLRHPRDARRRPRAPGRTRTSSTPRRRSRPSPARTSQRVAKQYLVKESRNVLLTTRKGGGEGMPRRARPAAGMAPGRSAPSGRAAPLRPSRRPGPGGEGMNRFVKRIDAPPRRLGVLRPRAGDPRPAREADVLRRSRFQVPRAKDAKVLLKNRHPGLPRRRPEGGRRSCAITVWWRGGAYMEPDGQGRPREPLRLAARRRRDARSSTPPTLEDRLEALAATLVEQLRGHERQPLPPGPGEGPRRRGSTC